MKYTKPPLSIAQQIQTLKDRGLIITDESRAARYLSFISYYRFRAYTYPYQNNADKQHPFKPNTTFDQILNTYLFDRKIRLLVFDAIERIEIAFRTQIIYHYSMKYGSQWYENSELFRKETLFKKDLRIIDKEVQRSYETFIKHYKKKYNQPSRPPAWMTLETASLGLLSKIYENLKLSDEKKLIAHTFQLKHPFILESWMHSLSVIRNIAAHHGRLWNRDVSAASMKNPKQTIAIWLDNRNLQKGKLYLVLSSIVFLLNTIIPAHHFIEKFNHLIAQYPDIPLNQMGFPVGWEKEKLWQSTKTKKQ